MKYNRKIIIGVITLGLVVVLAVFIYHSRQKQTQNQEGTTEDVSTSTPSLVESAFQDTDCATAATSSNSSLSVGSIKYLDFPWEIKTIKEKSTHANVDIEYPQFTGGDVVAKLNRCIYTLVSSVLNGDRQSVAEIKKDHPSLYSDPYASSVDLTSTYNVAGINNGIVSLEIIITDFTGGGNGNHDGSYPINWDLKSNRLLDSSDIFCSKDYISILMPLVRKQIIENFNQDNDFLVHPLSDFIIQWVNTGTSNDPNNWKYFLIRNDGLVVVFQPYQVTSGVGGIIRVFIPDSTKSRFLCLP
jgi:hypothetical protein